MTAYIGVDLHKTQFTVHVYADSKVDVPNHRTNDGIGQGD